jgi:hypothetical protein
LGWSRRPCICRSTKVATVGTRAAENPKNQTVIQLKIRQMTKPRQK